MRIGFYSPYFPKHTGGGEKYLLDVARALSQYGTVELAIPGESLDEATAQEILKKYEQFIAEKLDYLQLVASPLGTAAPIKEKLLWTKQYDLLYYLTDGSFFASLAKKNVLHIQTPLKRKTISPADKLKLLNWQFINTNSHFTKSVVEQHWGLKVNAVHQPMVDIAYLEALASKTAKQPIILHVGRFFKQLHSKRQDALVSFFKALIKKYPKQSKGWQLVLIGSVEDQAYAQAVKKQAAGLPIKIIHDVTRDELNNWYAQASLYWHATGHELAEADHPEKMEHFGISTVEAMASGAVPVVIGKGGQPEIIGDKLTELLWLDEADCLKKTAALMADDNKRQVLARAAQVRSQQFSPEKFEVNLEAMMKKLKLIK